MAKKQVGVAPSGPLETATKTYVDAGFLSTAEYRPADYGALAWTLDPQLASAASFSTGRIYYTRIKITASGTVGNINMWCNVAGAGMTVLKAGIYTTAGVLLAITADQKALFGTTGQKTLPLLVPLAVTAGQELMVAYLCAATTTMPSIAASVSAPAATIMQTQTTPYRQGQGTVTTNTDLPSNLTFTQFTPSGAAPLQLLTV
jgi:hypothetical protein